MIDKMYKITNILKRWENLSFLQFLMISALFFENITFEYWHLAIVVGFLLLLDVDLSDLRGRVNISSSLADNLEAVVPFWSEVTEIPINQFGKVVVDIRSKSGRNFRAKWPNGVCTIRVSNTKLKIKINTWLDLACELLL